MQKVTPFLWFDNRAEEAARFYTSVFKNSRMGTIARYGPGENDPVMTVQFWLEGEEFTALNGGPHYNFTPAVSFVVKCKDQAEVDYFWDKLTEGGTPEQCGWLRDKFGLSWQVIPEALPALLTGDPAGSQRAMQEMLKMQKIDLLKLEKAYGK